MTTVNCAKHHANGQMKAVQQVHKAEQISYGTTVVSKFPTPAKQVNSFHYWTKNIKKIDS